MFILMDRAELDEEELFCLEIWATLAAGELGLAAPELRFYRPAVTKEDHKKPKLQQKPHGAVLGFVSRASGNCIYLRGNLNYTKMLSTLLHELHHLKQHKDFPTELLMGLGITEDRIYKKFRRLMEYYADDYAANRLTRKRGVKR